MGRLRERLKKVNWKGLFGRLFSFLGKKLDEKGEQMVKKAEEKKKDE